MVFSRFFSGRKQSTDARFWDWFVQHQDQLFHFESDQERTFNRLRAALSKVHPDLTFEFGPDTEGRREFVISADGLKAAFPAVESLHASAPDLPRWTFVKFRPRREPGVLQIGDLKLGPFDLEVAIEADGEKAGLTVFVKGYDESMKNVFGQVAFIMLDMAVGEYDMETKVGFIEIKAFEETTSYLRHRLEDLPAVFDKFVTR